MPFWYRIPAPEIPESDGKAVRLVRWLLKERAEFHAGTEIAILQTPAALFAALANGEGFIWAWS